MPSIVPGITPDYDEPKRNNECLAVIAAILSGYSIGSTLGWPAPADRIMQVDGMEVEKLLHVIGIAYIGAAISQIYLALTLHSVGRKINMILAAILPIIFWPLMAIFTNFYIYLAARFCLGLSGSLFFVLAPTFIIEVVQKDVKIWSLLLFQLMLSIGVFIELMVGINQDRMTLCIPNVVAPSIVFLLMLYLRDSPAAYIFRNDLDGAGDSLRFYRGRSRDAEEELQDVLLYVDTIQAESKLGSICSPKGRKGLKIILICHTIQQFSGINWILLYNTDLFELSASKLNSPLCTTIFGSCFLVAWFVAILMAKRGRRILWRISTAWMALSVGILGIYFYLLNYNEVRARDVSYLPLVGMCFFSFAFAIGAGPLPFIMTTEVLPADSRITIGCLLIAYNFILGYINVIVVAILRLHMQEGHIFMGYMCTNLLSLMYTMCCLPGKKQFSYNREGSGDSF